MTSMMKIVCAWCEKVIRDGDENKGVSHGMCQDCYKEQVIMLDETEHYYIVS